MALEQDKNNEVVDQKLQETESMKKSLEDMLYTNNKNEHHNEDESDLRNQVNKFMDLVKTMDTLNSSVLLEKLAKSPEASKVLDGFTDEQKVNTIVKAMVLSGIDMKPYLHDLIRIPMRSVRDQKGKLIDVTMSQTSKDALYKKLAPIFQYSPDINQLFSRLYNGTKDFFFKAGFEKFLPEYLDQVKADVNDLNLKIDKSADANLVALSKKRLNENISKEKDLIAMITPYVPGGALDTNMMAKQEDKDKADADKLLSSFN